MIDLLKSFNRNAREYELRLQNIFAYGQLRPYMPKKFLPITGSSMNLHSILNILNDIAINSRLKILEFGSGISTIIIAHYAKINDIPIQIYSVDHDENWIALLKQYQIAEHVNFICAPLSKCDFSKHGLPWYDGNIIDLAVGEMKFDQVIVDGPIATRRPIRLSRYPVLPYVKNKLEANVSIFLDDADRRGEKQVMRYWFQEYGFKFKYLNSALACYYTNGSYNFSIK